MHKWVKQACSINPIIQGTKGVLNEKDSNDNEECPIPFGIMSLHSLKSNVSINQK